MKKFKTLGYVLSLALGMTMLTGCGKKVDGVDQQSMIDKYAAYCDLPDYKGLEYEETKSTVTDADVKTKIDSLLQQYATKTQVKEGTVKEGDNVNIDFVGSIDGEEFEGGNSNGAGYDLTLGSGAMIPGFEDGIIGHKVGETFNIKATFPENYGKDELNGKEADLRLRSTTLQRHSFRSTTMHLLLLIQMQQQFWNMRIPSEKIWLSSMTSRIRVPMRAQLCRCL